MTWRDVRSCWGALCMFVGFVVIVGTGVTILWEGLKAIWFRFGGG